MAYRNLRRAGAAALGTAVTLPAASFAHAQMRGDFTQADANHDGRVTFAEFQAYASRMILTRNGPMAQRFKQLSPDQQTAVLKQRFDKADASHKGFLTSQDWSGS